MSTYAAASRSESRSAEPAQNKPIRRSRRGLSIGAACALVLAGPCVAQATTRPAARTIHAIQRMTTLSRTGNRFTNVGTSDGILAGARVHGALRAVATYTSATRFTARGTLFYPAGTLTYKLDGTTTTGADGSLTGEGNGTFTGGSGSYSGAHGKFTAMGSKPANSFETWTLTGKVTYR